MTDNRTSMIVNWASGVQSLSPDALDLNEPATSVAQAMDLARDTAMTVNLPFETEPSNFVKLLHQLAPVRPGSGDNA